MPNNGNKVTILDIAEKADVSASTVSRVLRNSAGVTRDKREAVMRAVSDLDYRPNIFAQSLASGQSMTIGVLTQNFGSPFYDGILQGILQGLNDTGYWPLFADGQWQAHIEQEALNLFIARRVDGIIILGGRLTEESVEKFSTNLPLIMVARHIEAMPNQCVYVDNFQASYQMTQYLLEMGHRDIAFISAQVDYDETVDDIQQRHRAFLKALKDAGIEPDPRLIVEGNLQQQSGVLAVEMLLARGRPFTAIFSANDQMAFGARLALYRRGIRVPEDVSLVGFDDEASAAYMVPPLTTVRQPAVAMGKEAARAILAMINGESLDLKIHEASLTIRESVARHRQ